jgi:hypothetical protein
LDEDKSQHNLKWEAFNSSFVALSSDQDVYSAFLYTKSSQIDSFPYAGVVNTYMGGGYMFKMNNLGYNKSILVNNSSVKLLVGAINIILSYLH